MINNNSQDNTQKMKPKKNNHKKFNIMIHNYTRRYTTLYHEIKRNTAKYNDEN